MTTDQGKQHQKIHRGGGEEVGASLKSGHRQYRRASVLNTLIHFRPLPISPPLAVALGLCVLPENTAYLTAQEMLKPNDRSAAAGVLLLGCSICEKLNISVRHLPSPLLSFKHTKQTNNYDIHVSQTLSQASFIITVIAFNVDDNRRV